MILLGSRPSKVNKWESRLLVLGLLVLVFFSFWFIFESKPMKAGFTPVQAIFYSDLEVVKDGYFVTDEQPFGGGAWQSEEQAHSGHFSCKVPTADGIRYALTTTWGQLKGGQVWQVRVWHLRQPGSQAKLVIKAKENSDLYVETGVSVRQEGDWELYQASLFIPYQKVPPELQAYVYTDGKLPHFFDDIVIEQPRVLTAKEAGVSQLILKIGGKEMNRLEKKRQAALVAGILEQGADDWVDAQMFDSSRVFPVKLRLKGDWTDHLQGEKWSFRIKLKKDKSWNRLKTFSVHTPSTRYHLHEWLLHQFWKREGILTTYYDFVRLGVNEKELGIYALEEHFEKQLLERQERREGPILKLSEEGFWLGIDRQLSNHGYQKQGDLMTIMERKNAQPKVFKKKSINKSATLHAAWKTAEVLLSGFQEGTLGVEDIFDLDKLAKYYAIADLFDAYHALAWHNQRFYFNPVLGKLEPIGYDGFGAKPERRYRLLGEGGVADDNPYFYQLLGNKRFLTLYYQYLYQYSDARYFGEFIEEMQPRWTTLLPMIQSEFPDYQYTLDDFEEEAKYVHSLLLPFTDFSVLARHVLGTDSVMIGNKHALALRIVGFGNRKEEVNDSVNIWLSGRPSRRYQSRINRDALLSDASLNPYLYQDVQLHQSPLAEVKVEAKKDARFVFYQLLGVDSVFHAKIGAAPKKDAYSFIKMRRSNLADLKGKYFRQEGNKIIFLPGEIAISEPIIIARGYRVIFPEGGQYDLQNGAYILSYSPITAHGTDENPILFSTSDGSGRGISVLQSTALTDLAYVVFDGQKNYVGNGQAMSGAVNFYESTVHFDHCVFRNNHCEDALNVIRSSFVMSNTVFSNTQADGFDSDFSKGEISDSRFMNIGNDALDCSGSIVTVKTCEMTDCGDKGISAGEESDITAFEVAVSNASIAFASKDLSVLFLKKVKIIQCRQGFVAFEKKTEYGGAHIYVKGYEAEEVDRLSAVGDGSRVELD